jgi:glutamine synthetase
MADPNVDLVRELLDRFNREDRDAIFELLSEDFVEALVMVKEIEHEAYQRVISSWEREHLLLNV